MSNSKTISNDSSSRRSFLSKLGGLFAGAAFLTFISNLFAFNTAKAGPKSVQLTGDDYIGGIGIVAFNFAPINTALCNGQLMAISQNMALFSLLGTTYGGDGRTTFALPDLRGRVPIHAGMGPGLSNYILGQRGGVEELNLTANQLPSHSHSLNVNTGIGSSDTPSGNYLAENSEGIKQFSDTSNGTANPAVIGNTGSNQPVSVMQPYLALNYVIVLNGLFPQRN